MNLRDIVRADITKLEIDGYLKAYVSNGMLKIIIEDELKRLNNLIAGKCLSLSDSKRISARQSIQCLEECRKLCTNDLKRQVRTYSSIQWLVYLRCIPNRYFSSHDLRSSELQGRFVAEVIAANSYSIWRPMNVSPKLVKKLICYTVGVTFLCRIHALVKNSAIGIDFTTTNFLPETNPTQEQKEAIEIHERRMESSDVVFAFAGIYSEREYVQIGIKPNDYTIFRWAILERDQKTLPYQKWEPRSIEFPGLNDLLQNYQELSGIYPSHEFGEILTLLHLFTNIALQDKIKYEELKQFGYCAFSVSKCTSLLEAEFPQTIHIFRDNYPNINMPNTFEGIWDSLKNLKIESYPAMLNPIIREAGDVVIIDLVSASRRLIQLLEFPRNNGAISLIRKVFEDGVQDCIDRTLWRPNKRIRRYKGQVIEYEKNVNITDIDAIGVSGDKLLLVSCKSLIHSAKYDSGDYNTIRNVRTRMEEAVSDWKKIVSTIQSNKKGHNYDFSQFSEIIGVVCVSFPPYLEKPEEGLEETKPGLWYVSTPQELENWLNQNS